MKNTYKAKSDISINVRLSNGKSKFISFSPMSNGCSTYTTDKKEVIEAIERHYNFGVLFHLEKREGRVEESTAEESTIEESTKKGTVIIGADQVSDIASAKDYLADNFSISRTSLRSTQSIKEQALAHGIEFEVL